MSKTDNQAQNNIKVLLKISDAKNEINKWPSLILFYNFQKKSKKKKDNCIKLLKSIHTLFNTFNNLITSGNERLNLNKLLELLPKFDDMHYQ